MNAQQPQQPAQSARSKKSLPGYQQTPEPQAEPDALTHMSADALETVTLSLLELNYGSNGLTRDQIRKRYRDLPEELYLRLPASRRFHSAEDTLRQAGSSESRAEGDFMGAQPNIPEAESVADGGPPAWGGDPLLTRDAVEDGGSGEDMRDLTTDEDNADS
jgi:hypothetical protein